MATSSKKSHAKKAGNSMEAVKGGTKSFESNTAPNKSFSKKGPKSTRTPKVPSTTPPTPKSGKENKDTKEPPSTDNKPDDGYNEKLLTRMSKALTYNNWFHGLMPRDEIEELLVKDGDFLVRKTEVSKHGRFAVTVMNKSRIRHILLSYKNDLWSLRDLKKPTVTELIETHVDEKIPVMSDGTLLINGVPRPPFYILHDHIELKAKLGGGAFGDVYAGVWKDENGKEQDVAVKRLKGMMMKKQRSEFVKEAKLMRRFDHPNIVKVFGVAPQEEPMLIVLELAANGALRSKLKEHPELTKDTLLRYTVDACRGMCYLAGRKVIHRDIAARNCLIGKHDEVKISDFGLSVSDKNVLKLDKLKNMPVKWLAPEVLRRGEFSTKSDVWAFGVLVWEIFMRCKSEPFPGESNSQAKAKILSGSQPMQAPEGAPEIVKSVMMLCFMQESDQRPDFEGVLKLLAPREIPPPKMPDFDTYAVQ